MMTNIGSVPSWDSFNNEFSLRKVKTADVDLTSALTDFARTFFSTSDVSSLK